VTIPGASELETRGDRISNAFWLGRSAKTGVLKEYEPIAGREKGMTKRSVRIIKHLGSVPCVAACTACGREFKIPLRALARVNDAQANLQEQFDRHKCQREEPAQS
jgi:hypothetical protein